MNGIVLMVFQREMCKRSHPSLVPWVVCDPEVAMLGLGGGSLPRHQLLRMENESSFGTGRETEWALKRLEYQYHPNLSHKQLCNCTKWTAFSLPIKWRRDKVSPSSVSFGLSLFLLSLTACLLRLPTIWPRLYFPWGPYFILTTFPLSGELSFFSLALKCPLHALSHATLILSNQEGRHAFPWALEGTSGMSEEPELPTGHGEDEQGQVAKPPTDMERLPRLSEKERSQ